MTAVLLAVALLTWPTGGHRRGAAGRVGISWRTIGRRGGVVAGLGVVVATGLAVRSLPLAAALTMVASTGALLSRNWLQRRRSHRTMQSHLQLTRALARELQAGGGIANAVDAVLPGVSADARPLLSRLSAAARFDTAELPSAGLPPDPVERSLHAGLRMSRRLGIPLSDVLLRLAGGIEDELMADDQRATAVAGATLSGYLLAGLPVVGVLLGLGMGANPLPVLFGGGAGAVLLIVGVSLTCAGLLWSARIAR